MEVAVFDTYVNKKGGGVMHFDIIVPKNTQHEQVLEYGKEYLVAKGQKGQPVSSKECRFCHVESIQEYMEDDFNHKGYYILEMHGC